MSDNTVKELDESALSANRTSNSEFFIDDYSHLRLSYYQHRDNDNASFDVSGSAFQDSAYSTNASTSSESFRENKDLNNTDSINPKVLSEEERRKLREYYVSQIPDLPHPSYTVASIIASASHRMDPVNRFVYNNRIEQGKKPEEDMVTFAPQRRSTLKPDSVLK